MNPDSIEENGYMRLSQRCDRCAYISTISTEVENEIKAELICQRHSQHMSMVEAAAFTCDYFC